jgi:t-SNARE complex subunit (syntaxin)
MDIKFQKQLIKISLDQANLAESDTLTDLFLNQAKRLQRELDDYLNTNPQAKGEVECTTAQDVEIKLEVKSDKRKLSYKPVKRRTQTKSKSKKSSKSKKVKVGK